MQFKDLTKNEKKVCILYSHTKNGWENIIAYNPVETFQYKIGEKNKSIKNFLNFVKKNQKKKRKLIGYISYDIGYELYNIKKTAKDDLKLPDIYFLAFEKWHRIKEIDNTRNKKQNNKNFKPTITKKSYNKAYKKIKKYIIDGDIYQINLTHRLEAKTGIPARELFRRVINKNPVDHSAYLEGEGFEIISASPERFIKIENETLETCPVKGTRPRGKSRLQDEKLKKELIENEKEAAELNMITDLLRNDAGKVCEIGSVKVEGHRLLSQCPTVWHTYSRITGKIAKRTTSVEALLSMLPGGSITGCPKKRAMEIIDELESTTRSVYTGVIGYIDSNGDLDFNIAIRTIIKKDDKLYLQVGGGIVLDSTNKAEYEETLHKAASFMEIL